MYLAELKLWNFRKYGTKGDGAISESNPGLVVYFKEGLNVLVGENNSGKTAIIDAIRFILFTQSYEYQRLDDRDFHGFGDQRKNELKIECIFNGFDNKEAANFLEWLGFDENGRHFLKLWLYAYRKDNRVIADIKAGADDEGTYLEGAARDLIRVTYLKPLRDADIELSPGNRSRLAQIFRNDPVFKKNKKEDGRIEKHPFEIYLDEADNNIKEFFNKEILEEREGIPPNTKGGKHIKDKIKIHLDAFLERESELKNPILEIGGSELLQILHRLSLKLEENKTGLGILNQLYIATELILLKREEHRGLRLGLIEELEAHLHPQAQLRMIEYLQSEENKKEQFILTTHSTTLASKIKLENIILSYEDKVYPLHKGKTLLKNDDYEFLERFLDSTKANLFFARGIILVEGDAENILFPTIAFILDRKLEDYGISIVNVGSKALIRYAKILISNDKSFSPIKMSVVTDLDIAQVLGNDGNVKSKRRKLDGQIPQVHEEKQKLVREFETNDGNTKVFSSPLWTLEYDLLKSGLKQYLNQAIRLAQLSNSRLKNGNYDGLNEGDILKYCEKADKELNKLSENYNNNEDKTALVIFQKLQNKKASKAVTAQWLSKLLIKNESNVKPILISDPQLEYLRDAIYHVTKKPESENHS